ncbi:hypothetical protein ABZS66_36230 [Dactylosporangium sp. NPDC005572]|uniref:hypothetical protein n=1 Tax=Dactylosporangium sp. NPDC005572 TaxID=3156889 RepID=UPI0033AFF825
MLPLDAYQLSEKEYVTVQRAAWRLIRDCVQRFGGEYTVPEGLVTADLPRFEHANERRYGLFDADSAAARGYNIPPDLQPVGRDKSAGWNPSEAEKLLVRGVDTSGGSPVAVELPTDRDGKRLPVDGCTGEANRTLGGGQQASVDTSLGNTLSLDAGKRAEADSRVRDAMQQWGDCMARRGYSYSTIWEPNDRKWPEPAGDEEIATATADVACKKETNLLGVWFAVESAYQQRIIDERIQELTAVQMILQTRAKNAAGVVSGG